VEANKMKKKIIGIFICMLMSAAIFGSNPAAAEEIEDPSEFIPNPCEIPDGMMNQTLSNSGERPLVFEPPWPIHWPDIEATDDAGVVDLWEEGTTTTGDYGKTHTFGWAAGAGAGYQEIWLCHGFYFEAPVTDTYTFTFDYSMEGCLTGEQFSSPYGAAEASSQVWFMYIVGDKVEMERTQLHVAVGSILDYSVPFDDQRTCTMYVDLIAGTTYFVGAEGYLMDFVLGFLAAGAEIESWTEGDHARLNRVTIDWPNHPPNIPEIPNGPETASVGKENTFSTITTDPEGDNIRYGWDFGDGTSTQWGDWSDGYRDFAEYTWEGTGTYKVRVKAEDEFGAKSEWSDPLTVEITNDPPSKPDVWYESVSLFESEYYARSNDPDGHQIKYVFKFDDGTVLSTGFMNSGQTGSVIYKKQGGVVWAVDEYGAESPRASQSCSSNSNSTDDSSSDSSDSSSDSSQDDSSSDSSDSSSDSSQDDSSSDSSDSSSDSSQQA
jgi:hypothetical protein